MRATFFFSFLTSSVALLAVADSVFPEFESIPAAERFPQQASLTSHEGTFYVNHQPRFIIGTTFFEGADRDPEVHSPGYPPSLHWLYESLPDYPAAQRLGLDAFGATPPRLWRARFRPDAVPRRNMTLLSRPLHSGLPILAELAIEPNTHAWMSYMENVRPPETAWFEGSAQGIPYSLIHAEGTNLWQQIWTSDVQSYAQMNVVPTFYRIFANADYFDTSRSAQTPFLRWLEKKWSSVHELNKAIGKHYSSFSQVSRTPKTSANLGVLIEYIQFLEAQFAARCVQAQSIIFQTTSQSNAWVCFQSHAPDAKGIDCLQANQSLPLLSAPANSVSPRYTAHYLQALAQGRPVFAPPVTPSGDAEQVRAALFETFARGYAIAFLEKWQRHPRQWVKYSRAPLAPGKRPATHIHATATEAAARAYAKDHPEVFLNPAALAPEALMGIRLAKQDALLAAPYFLASNQTQHAAVGILHSRAAVRLAHARNTPERLRELPDLTDTLTLNHFPTQILLEEHLSEQSLASISVLVVPPLNSASLPQTPTLLKDFVQKGGTLLVSTNALRETPYGLAATNVLNLARLSQASCPSFPPFNWPCIADPKGKIIAIPPDHSVTHSALPDLLTHLGVVPTCIARDATTQKPITTLEVIRAIQPDQSQAFIFINTDEAPLNAILSIPNLPHFAVLNLRTHAPIPTSPEGTFPLTLGPRQNALLLLTPIPQPTHP